MTNESESTLSKVSKTEVIEVSDTSPVVYFITGFLLGLISYAVAGASMEFTHTAIAEVGWLKLAIVGAIPFICGGLAVWLKDSFTDSMMKLVASVGNVIG